MLALIQYPIFDVILEFMYELHNLALTFNLTHGNSTNTVLAVRRSRGPKEIFSQSVSSQEMYRSLQLSYLFVTAIHSQTNLLAPYSVGD